MTACHRRLLPDVMLGDSRGRNELPGCLASSRACGEHDCTAVCLHARDGGKKTGQPFTPEAAIELTNCFWKRTNMMITGTVMTEL